MTKQGLATFPQQLAAKSNIIMLSVELKFSPEITKCQQGSNRVGGCDLLLMNSFRSRLLQQWMCVRVSVTHLLVISSQHTFSFLIVSPGFPSIFLACWFSFYPGFGPFPLFFCCWIFNCCLLPFGFGFVCPGCVCVTVVSLHPEGPVISLWTETMNGSGEYWYWGSFWFVQVFLEQAVTVVTLNCLICHHPGFLK